MLGRTFNQARPRAGPPPSSQGSDGAPASRPEPWRQSMGAIGGDAPNNSRGQRGQRGQRQDRAAHPAHPVHPRGAQRCGLTQGCSYTHIGRERCTYRAAGRCEALGSGEPTAAELAGKRRGLHCLLAGVWQGSVSDRAAGRWVPSEPCEDGGTCPRSVGTGELAGCSRLFFDGPQGPKIEE